MLELIKRLIKWIIIVILFIILIIFIVGLVKKADSSKNTKVYKPVVQTIKNNDEEDYSTNNNDNNSDNNVEVYQNDNQAELPDTASPRDSLLIIIGTVVLGSGCFYIYKNRNITE